MKKICFIAQFPPPIHGLSKAVETLYNSKLSNDYCFEKIDITNNKKIFSNVFAIAKSEADLYYFTISQTEIGNFRDLFILKLLEKLGKNCLIHLHGGYYRHLVDNEMFSWQRKSNYKAMKKLVGAVVLGPSLRYIFQDMVPEKKIFSVANCVDDEFLISDKEFEDKIDNINKTRVKHVLFLSNFIKSKGYFEVLKMAKIEKNSIDSGNIQKLHFDFAGKFFSENDKKEFLQYIRNNQLHDIVTYHGIVTGLEKRELLKKSIFFVLPTNYPKEGQPISILEAMGNGNTIITTKHAGIPDIIKDKENGLFVSHVLPNDINDIINDLPLSEIAAKNRSIVLSKFTEKTYINNMKEVFEYTLKQM